MDTKPSLDLSSYSSPDSSLPPPQAPPSHASQAGKCGCVGRRWPTEEGELLLRIVPKYSSKIHRIFWAPIVEELALRYPPPAGLAPGTIKQVQVHWYKLSKQQSAEPAPAEPAPAEATPQDDDEGHHYPSKKHRTAIVDQPFTPQDDEDVLNLHRIWPGQLKRIARSLLPPRHKHDIRRRLEHLLSLSPSSGASTARSHSHRKHHHLARHRFSTGLKGDCHRLNAQHSQQRSPEASSALAVQSRESREAPKVLNTSPRACLEPATTLLEARNALGELSKPW